MIAVGGPVIWCCGDKLHVATARKRAEHACHYWHTERAELKIRHWNSSHCQWRTCELLCKTYPGFKSGPQSAAPRQPCTSLSHWCAGAPRSFPNALVQDGGASVRQRKRIAMSTSVSSPYLMNLFRGDVSMQLTAHYS